MDDFSRSEEYVLKLLSIAQETAEELEKLPKCDTEKLKYLSKNYLTTTQDIKNSIKSLPIPPTGTQHTVILDGKNTNSLPLLEKSLELILAEIKSSTN